MRLRATCFAFVAIMLSSQTVHAAHLIDFSFPLSTGQTNPEATFPSGSILPTGLAMVQVDINANTISWDISYENLTGPIVAPGAHLHGPASLGSNAGIQVFLTDGVPSEPATGTLMGSASITESQKAELLAGLWYLNIHTAANPSGELRGQVVNIPEPATLTLMVGSLVALAAARRRRA